MLVLIDGTVAGDGQALGIAVTVAVNERVIGKRIVCWGAAIGVHAQHLAKVCIKILGLLTKIKSVTCCQQ